MNRILVAALLMLSAGRLFGACSGSSPNLTVASNAPADVTDCFTAAAPGDTVNLLSGTTHWTGGINVTPPANMVLKGAGTPTTGGGDQTVIIDDSASGSALMAFTIAATGTFRVTGITVQSGTGATKDNGTIVLTGPGAAHVDHSHFASTTLSNYKIVEFYNGVSGVLDHCVVDLLGTNALYFFNGLGAAANHANFEWTQPTNFGGSDYFFIEDDIINGIWDGFNSAYSTRIFDGATGSKIVVRFNTVVQASLGETHATGHSNDDRGLRSQEVYGNSVTSTLAHDPNFVALDMGSGTTLIWGNSWDQCYKNIYHFNVTRKNNDTYTQLITPNSWGYSAGTLHSGTVNATTTAVTWVSGDHFDTNWVAGEMISIPGAACVHAGQSAPVGEGCRIASVQSSTALTLQDSISVSPLTAVAYTVGTAWDGNTDILGYPCVDQPGRGSGDLLTGDFPSKVNSTTGTIAWLNQPLEPIYMWNNVGTLVVGFGGSTYSDNTAGRVVANRDYYPTASGIQTTSSSPFDGTTGTGWGTLANRPTTCTTGVGYFATDQGSWNTSSSNPYGVQQNGASGVLYQCTSTNTWTLYYTPYTYPHPLNIVAGGGAYLINGVPIM